MCKKDIKSEVIVSLSGSQSGGFLIKTNKKGRAI